MKIAAFVGSPIRGGNVDSLVRQMLASAEAAGADSELIYTNSLRIIPCQSCLDDPYPQACFYRDDMDRLYEMLASSDALIIGTPMYFDSVNAQMKVVMERCNCLATRKDSGAGRRDIVSRLPKRKKAALVAVSGRDSNFECLEKTVRRFLNWINTSLDYKIYFAGGDRIGKGGIADIPSLMDRALHYGRALAGGEYG